jgi:hypothetical protein
MTCNYTLQITDTNLCLQPVTVSASRFLAVDFNTGTIKVSLNYAIQIPHIKSSFRSRTLAPNYFLHSLPHRNLVHKLGHPDCLQDNISAGTAQKTQPLYWCRGVLPRRCIVAENAVFLLFRACMLRALPSNGHCFQSHRIATGLYATVLWAWKIFVLRFSWMYK